MNFASTRAFRLLTPLLCLFAIGPGRAQSVPAERVAGKVVSARDGRPLPHTAVALLDQQSGKTVAETSSGEDGTFRFAPVPAGKYNLLGRRAGYLPASYLQHGQLSTAIVTGKGLATDALLLQLRPVAAISGHILDEAGEPVPHATVVLYRENPAAADAERVTRVRAMATEDDGAYEFDGLASGHYFLSAAGTPWYAVHPPTGTREESRPYRTAVDPALDVAYPMVFYPHGLSSEEASPIVLGAGDEVTANLAMLPQHSLTITLPRNPAGTAPQQFPQLTRSVFGAPEQVFTQMDYADGEQRLTGVAPGQYTLQQYALGGAAFPVRSEALDLTRGSLTLDPLNAPALASVEITVHAADGTPLGRNVQVNLRSPASNRVVANQVNEKGIAAFPNLPPGDYRVAVFRDGTPIGIAKVAFGEHPAPDKYLHITASGSLTGELTIGGAPVRVEGFARRDGKAAAASMIVLVPAGADTSEELFRRDQSDLDGSFIFDRVLPGNYLVVALDDAWAFHWKDTAALTPYLLHAVPVSIAPDGPRVVHLAEPIVTQAH